jgi:hypothetical protein
MKIENVIMSIVKNSLNASTAIVTIERSKIVIRNDNFYGSNKITIESENNNELLPLIEILYIWEALRVIEKEEDEKRYTDILSENKNWRDPLPTIVAVPQMVYHYTHIECFLMVAICMKTSEPIIAIQSLLKRAAFSRRSWDQQEFMFRLYEYYEMFLINNDVSEVEFFELAKSI